ncbi:MAG: peptidase M20 [Pyrinomonas sp.]
MVASTSILAPAATVRELLRKEQVSRAFARLDAQARVTDDEHAAICAIPSSPFGEQQRARALAERFRRLGLRETKIDAEGNCVALRPGRRLHPLLVLSAHLDTVFPPGTDFTVRRKGSVLRAPGIADDGCGLVALLALLDALEACAIETEGSILFIGTVGEEGEGNLRGVRYLLQRSEWANEIDAFISLDGPGLERITNGALASRRFRVRFVGAGGHSWGDFGIANPIHALGRAITHLSGYPLAVSPRTSFNVGRVQGGAGVNVIAREASMDVDLRSEASSELERLTEFFHRAVQRAAETENEARLVGTTPLEVEIELLGERPGGETPVDSPLVQLAMEATRVFGATPRLECASTDANIAIARGIPAITIGVGGTSGNVHTLDEWYDARGRQEGLKRALLVALGTVGMVEL